METIIEKYYLEQGSKLVNYQEGANGVDCWFDSKEIRQHRCLSFEDFELIKNKWV
jgi:Zn/Cd-binding protein ZinT